jgi:Protein of unknown function (DUF4235)
VIKLMFKPLSLVIGLLSGILARGIFMRIWRLAAREDEAPEPTDARRGWREILLAAALQGAIFAAVKAAVDRGAAVSTRKMTGVWPGEDGEEAGQQA